MPRTQRIAEFAGYRLDYAERSLLSPSGEAEQLSRRLFDTLAMLVEHSGKLVEKHELMSRVWADVVVEENTLSRTVSALRQKLGEAAGEPRFIATVSGMGYRFIPPVTFIPRGEAVAPDAPRTLAVLPFDDFSPAKDMAHVADGLVDEMIATLAGISALRVTARTSVFQLRGCPARTAATKLGVAYVLTGSVRTEANRVRVAVQLVDAESEQQLWSTRHDGLGTELFALQEDLARRVVDGLTPWLRLPAAPARAQHSPHPVAFDLLLRARATALQSGGPASARSYGLVKQALEHDPDYVVAWCMLSHYALTMRVFGVPMTPEIAADLELARRRIKALEPDSWAANLATAMQFIDGQDWLNAEKSLDRACEVAGVMPTELAAMRSFLRAAVGRIDQALSDVRDVIAKDPLSLRTSGVYQLTLHTAGLEDLAEAEYQRSLELPGDRDMVEHLAIHRRWARGQPFHDQLRRYLAHQSTVLPVLRHIESVLDQPSSVTALLRDARSDPHYAPPARQMILSWWLARYQQWDDTMDVLWKVYVDQRHLQTSWLWWPVFAPLWPSASFQNLLGRIGLVRYWRESGRAPSVPGLAVKAPA